VLTAHQQARHGQTLLAYWARVHDRLHGGWLHPMTLQHTTTRRKTLWCLLHRSILSRQAPRWKQFGLARLDILCRGLCRNPAIPARPTPSLLVSLGNTRETANTQKTHVNTAFPYHLSSLSIVRLHIGQGIDTVEVWGSSPHVPTISFNTYRQLPSLRR